MTMTNAEIDQMAIDLALTDLVIAAQHLFAARTDLTELTIERRGDAACVELDGHW
jgi:hypothetical protein